MLIQQIEEEVAPFAAINDRANSTGILNSSDQAALIHMAPMIVRNHMDFFVSFFATWLCEIDPDLRLQVSDGSYEYVFRDQHDAADAAETAIGQVLDGGLAASVSLLILMAFLKRSNRNASVTAVEAHASIRTIARLAYGYRIVVFQDLVREGRALQRQDVRRRWISRAVLVGAGLFVGWLLFK